jgi:hypothetical protein
VILELKPLTTFANVREAARITAHKRDVSTKPLANYALNNYFLSEHSPIRSFIIRVKFYDISRRVAMHLVRHVHSLPFVSSTRPDRFPNQKDDQIVDMIQDFNAQALIDMARKRLCLMSYPETVKTIRELKHELMCYESSERTEQEAVRALGSFLVPNCVYRGGCPENSGCRFYGNISKKLGGSQTIAERYEVYNAFCEEE